MQDRSGLVRDDGGVFVCGIGGGRGGQVVVCGTPEEVAACEKSYTGKYLKDKLK